MENLEAELMHLSKVLFKHAEHVYMSCNPDEYRNFGTVEKLLDDLEEFERRMEICHPSK